MRYRKEEARTRSFRRNAELEQLLVSLNDSLGAAEERLLEQAHELGSDHPIVFIVGPLRSCYRDSTARLQSAPGSSNS